MSIHFRDRTPKIKYLKITVTHENEGSEIARTYFVTVCGLNKNHNF